MYTVLIVDDEKMIRTGMQKVIFWNTIDVDKVYTSASAIEALELLKTVHVDIVITDINMSEMTGIDMIQQIKALYPLIKILVLTGYDKFEYAQECLRMGVEDFFVKPIEEKVLTEKLKQLIDDLKTNEEEKKREGVTKRVQGCTDQTRLESIMRELIYKYSNTYNLCEVLLNEYKYENRPMQIEIIVPEIFPGEQINEEKNTVLSMKKICNDFIDMKEDGITFMDKDDRIIITWFCDRKKTVPLMSEDLHKFLHSEQKCIPHSALGSRVNNFNELKISYNDALTEIQLKDISLNENRKYTFQAERKTTFYQMLKNLEEQMILKTHDIHELMNLFDNFWSNTENLNVSLILVRRSCFELASSLYFFYSEKNKDNNQSRLDVLSMLLLKAEKEEAIQYTYKFIFELFNNESKDDYDLIVQAKRYINANLSEDLSVSDIAASLSVTSNYFSRLFKKSTGQGCNEYIVEKRIEKAKVLLETTNFKILKICEMVGYHDTNYFSLAFKKQTGIAPSNYRETIRESLGLIIEEEKENT